MLDLFPDSARIEKGELVLGGVRTSELAERFGTPARRLLRGRHYARGRETSATPSPPHTSSTARRHFRTSRSCGSSPRRASARTCSTLGELAFARAAGIEGEQLVVHGNAKSDEELRAAAAAGATVVLDGDEAERALGGRCQARSRSRNAWRRSRHARGDPRQDTTARSSAFRRSTRSERSTLLARSASTWPAFTSTSDRSSRTPPLTRRRSSSSQRSPLAAAASSAWTPELVNVGGGFAIRHVLEEPETSLGELARGSRGCGLAALGRRMTSHRRDSLLEPGRALVGQAGATLYRVRTVKRLDGLTWVAVDGGHVRQPASGALRRSLYGPFGDPCRRAGDRDGQHRGPPLRVRRRSDRRRSATASPRPETCSPSRRRVHTHSR